MADRFSDGCEAPGAVHPAPRFAAACAAEWEAGRSSRDNVSLDVARCGRPSDRVIAAMQRHLVAEQHIGGYEAEAAAAPQLDRARLMLAAMMGVPRGRVEFVANGTSAMAQLLASWPWRPGMRVALPRSEFASTRLVLERLAKRERLRPIVLQEDSAGRVALDAFGRLVAGDSRPSLVVVSHVPSHRGIVQPLPEIAELCSQAEARLVVDGCQSLGHVEVPCVGAAAVVGTSRKWLHGPRGVGFVAVEETLWEQLDGPPTLQTHASRPEGQARLANAPALELSEAAVAARLGLATALEETGELVSDVAQHVLAIGRSIRHGLREIPGWRLREGPDEPTALVTFDAPSDETLSRVLVRLRERGIHAGQVPAGRALDLPRSILRLAPEPVARLDWLETVRDVLARAR